MLFDVATQLALSEGLNYTMIPTVLPMEDIISGVEIVICALPVKAVEEV
jgi:hypothetical protein